MDLSVSFSHWCLGMAAVCDCDTPWTFFLLFVGVFLCFPPSSSRLKLKITSPLGVPSSVAEYDERSCVPVLRARRNEKEMKVKPATSFNY